MSDFMPFGELMRRHRRALDLTQQELADRVGCATTTIVKLENETRRPSREMAARLADVLGLSPAERGPFLNAARRKERSRAHHLVGSSPAHEATPAGRRSIPLPVPLLPLIGRDGEMAVLRDLFARREGRLVTIVGPGGIGKTRLALQVAAELAPQFADGISFVPTASLTSVGDLVVAMADATGCPFQDAGDVAAQLAIHLRPLHGLLVLDSVEHLLGDDKTVTLVATLLEQAPRLAFLITSRERLNLRSEWVFELQGLATPPEPRADAVAPAQIEAYPSTNLFLQHAQHLRPTFVPTSSDATAIAHICRAVEGLPLAIELSAAWTSTLSCEEIAREIQSGIDFLSGAFRDLPPRHRSMRAVFDHSWRLLQASEQQVMRRLAVFRGGFTRRAAEQVAGASLRQLSALVAKSLVRHGDGGRYDLHELIGQYSAAQLQAAGEEDLINQAHAEYYLALAAGYLDRLQSADQKQALAELNRDIDNLRSAWEWAVNNALVGPLQQAAWAYWYYLDMRNLYREEQEAFARAAAALESLSAAAAGGDPPVDVALAQMRTWLAFACFRLGQVEEGRALLRDAVPTLRHHGALAELADALWVDGLLCWLTGAFDTGVTALEESLALNRSLARRWQMAFVPLVLGAVRHEQGAYAEAYVLLRHGLDLCQELGVPRNTAFALGLLARTVRVLGYADDLRMLMREHLRLATEMEDRSAMAFVMENLALAVEAAGDPVAVRQYFGDAIAHFLELGDLWSASRALCHAGNFELAQGAVNDARQLFRRGLQAALAGQSTANALDSLVGLAEACARTGDEETAGRLAHVVVQTPASSQAAKERASQLIVELSEGPEATQAHALTLDEAVAMALRT